MGHLRANISNFYTRQSVYGNILVGFSFLALTLLTVKTLAPQIDTDATSQTASQTVGPWSLSMANDSAVTINITPTSSQAVYTATNNLSVTNSCTAGATITMTTNSTASNSLTRAAVSSDTLEKNIAATTAANSLSNNSWGYSLNSGSTYNAVPKKGTTAATIYDASAAQTTALSVPVMFGVKTDNNMPSGAYTNDVVYTMTPKAGCLTYSVTWDFDGGTAKSGATYPTSLNWGATVNLSQLTPTRNGYTFAGWTNGSSNYAGTETAANLNSANSTAVTVKALWTATPYSISYTLDGGSVSGTNPTSYTIETSTFTLINPTKSGFKFKGWTGTNGTAPQTSVSIAKGSTGNRSYTANWEEEAATMQTFSCSSLSSGGSVTLKDSRDQNSYVIKKLADGKCWMTQNLKLINKTISSSDSNLPSGSTWTVPASNVSSFTTAYNTNAAYYDSTYGGYYSFYTATAGWGTNSVTSGSSSKDICPKGWRLPTGGSSGEFQTLYNNYNSSALMQGVPGFVLSGSVYNGSVYDQGSNGCYWSSTVGNANLAYSLYLDNSNVYPANSRSKFGGFSVRCVAS